MWKTLIGLVKDVFDLNRRVKGHDQQLDELFGSTRDTSAHLYRLSERVLRLELELQHAKEQHAREVIHLSTQQAAEREQFRLQLENLLLRT